MDIFRSPAVITDELAWLSAPPAGRAFDPDVNDDSISESRVVRATSHAVFVAISPALFFTIMTLAISIRVRGCFLEPSALFHFNSVRIRARTDWKVRVFRRREKLNLYLNSLCKRKTVSRVRGEKIQSTLRVQSDVRFSYPNPR